MKDHELLTNLFNKEDLVTFLEAQLAYAKAEVQYLDTEVSERGLDNLKPVAREQLLKGGWFLRDPQPSLRYTLQDLIIPCVLHGGWNRNLEFAYFCTLRKEASCTTDYLPKECTREIFLIGKEFYWSPAL